MTKGRSGSDDTVNEDRDEVFMLDAEINSDVHVYNVILVEVSWLDDTWLKNLRAIWGEGKPLL